MDKAGDMSGQAANNSSDFVSAFPSLDVSGLIDTALGPEVIQVSRECLIPARLVWAIFNEWKATPANSRACRMLEDPSYEAIVRWGEGGESFVVLNVRHVNEAWIPSRC
jgi:hypothetical protein